jgi:hypothetical protein
MRRTILYPFRIDTNFHAGYSWSAELSRRLKSKLSLFTTLDPSSSEPVADVYRGLANAQGFYVKHFQVLQLRLSPVPTERHFVQGEFSRSFSDFVQENPPEMMILQSNLFSNERLKEFIHSGQKIIVLPPIEIPAATDDRAQLFITILGKAALYNIPNSFFNNIGKDHSLFNAITRFFKH